MFDLEQLLLVPIFWSFGFPLVFWRFFVRWNLATDRNLGISLTLRYLFVPLFGDYTRMGRLIGGVYRLIVLIFLFGFLLVCDVILVALFFLWYFAPFLLFYYLKFWAFLIIAGIWLIVFFYRRDRHLKFLSQIAAPKDITDAFPRPLRRSFSKYDQEKPHFLFLELLDNNFFVRFLLKLGIGSQEFYEILNSTPLPKITREQLLKDLYDLAKSTKSRLVFVEHLFLAFYQKSPDMQKAFVEKELHPEDISGAVDWVVEEDLKNNPPKMWDFDYIVPPIGGVDRARTSRPTPHLDSVSEDLTWQASRGLLPQVVGKDEVMDSILRVLSRSGHDNVLIIGEPGSGKTTLVGGIAQQIVLGTSRDFLQSKRLVCLDPGALSSHAVGDGGLSDKIGKIIKEIKAAGNIILFIDEIHNLAAISGEGSSGGAAIFASLQPHIGSKAFQIIGATDYANFKKYIEPNGAFARLFQKVELKEANFDQSLAILRAVSLDMERKERVIITFPALRKAISVSDQVIYDRVLPDKAVDLLDEAVAFAKESSRSIIAANDILEVAQKRTGIPIKNITFQESDVLLNLEDRIHQQVINQKEAIKAVSDALRRARAGLTTKGRPLASFLFIGPTGVGKTETAKALANVYFGGEKMMIRLDMSEYQERSSLARLIGPPPGHPDASAGGQLTEAVRRQPFSLILLDEIEKAHPDVLLLFLQVLDDARLTDGMGRTVNFSNTIIIATSNVGTATIQEGVSKGEAFEQIKQEAMQSLQQKFKPEFLNRFDGIITFQPLLHSDVLEIARLLLKSLAARMQAKDIRLEFNEDLVEALARSGFDSQWGARPLRRFIQDRLESPLAKFIISGRFKKGDVARIGVRFLEDGVLE